MGGVVDNLGKSLLELLQLSESRQRVAQGFGWLRQCKYRD